MRTRYESGRRGRGTAKALHFTEPILTRLNLRQMRYVLAVARTGSIGKAAAELHIAQPPLSRQIKAIEHNLGATLFERTREGARLTPAGTAFQRSATKLMAAIQRFVTAARLAERGEFGTIRIGVGHVPLLSPRIGAFLAALRRRYPDVMIEMPLIPGPEQYRALRAGEIDIAISPTPPREEPGIEWRTFYDDPLDAAAIGSTTALAQEKTLTIAELRGERLILPSQRLIPHVMTPIIAALAQLGFTKYEEHDSMATIAAHVAAGRGWIPATHSLRGRLADGRVAVPVEGLNIPFRLDTSTRKGESARLVHNVLELMDELRNADWNSSAIPALDPNSSSENGGDPRGDIPSALEIRHLRAFMAVMHEQDRARAADDLRLSELGLSLRIRQLERAIGATLFERSGRSIIATPPARALEPLADDALRILDDIPERARAVERGVTGRTAFGVVPEALGVVMPMLLAMLTSEFPHVEVKVEEMGSPGQPRELEEGHIDIGIAHPLPGLRDDAAIDGQRIMDDRLDSALVAADHPLARKPMLMAMDLQRLPLLLGEPDSHRAYYDLLIRALGSIGLDPMIDGQYESVRAQWTLAATGAGWVLGSHSQRSNPPPGLVAVPIEGFSLRWGFDALWRRGEQRAEVFAVVRLLRGIVWRNHSHSR